MHTLSHDLMISLVTSITSNSYKLFSCDESFYFLSYQLLNIQYHIVNYRYCTLHLVHYIPRTYFSYIWKLISFDHLHSFHLPLTSGNHQSILSMSFAVLDSTYMWDHIVFIFVWLISFNIMPSKSIHIATNSKISFFLMAK